jgi:hypothetical protein
MELWFQNYFDDGVVFVVKNIFIGSKSGTDPAQIAQRIEIQLRLEKELIHPNISFRYIEIQPPGNLNRDLMIEERRQVEYALENNFTIGFEFPHIWSGRDIDPCVVERSEDILEIAQIARNVGASYIFINPGDIGDSNFNIQRWNNAKEAHLNILQQIKEIHPVVGIENTNPIRHLESRKVYGFFGMFPDDLFLFDFVVLDIAHAQFTVNHFQAQEKISSIFALEQIHNRWKLNLHDYTAILKDKIQVVHVANAVGLGDLDKEGLVMSEGEADCNVFITDILKNRSTPIRFVAEPSNIPYGIDFHALGDIMYSEEKEIFSACLAGLK